MNIPGFSRLLRYLNGKNSREASSPSISEAVTPSDPPPASRPASDQDRETLAAASRACLAFKHVFPPRHPRSSLSFLGGLPMAPADFEWPMAKNSEGLLEWLPFVGQIDCSKIPSDIPSPLPTQGVLFFFLPTASGLTPENQKLAVHYVAEKPGPKWMEHPGFGLPPLNGLEEARYRFPWLNWLAQPAKSYPVCYPRTEIELGWIDYGDNGQPMDEEEAAGLPWEIAAANHRANLIAFHGEPVPHDPLLSPGGKSMEKLWCPHEGFPLSWKAVEIVGGYLKVFLREQHDLLQKKEAEGKSEELPDSAERLSAFHDQIETAAGKLLAGTFKGNAEPSPQEKAQFWSLLESLLLPQPLPLLSRWKGFQHIGLQLNKWLAEAATRSAEACLNDPAHAARVPREVIDALRWRHSVLKEHMFKDNGWHHQHQMLGRGRVIQYIAEEMAGTHLLLLQLGPDDPMDWQMGDNGAYQFWITPSDLAARNFDRVVVTFECH